MVKNPRWEKTKQNRLRSCDDCGARGARLINRANGTIDTLCRDCDGKRDAAKYKIQQEAYRKGRKMAQANGDKCQQCGKVCGKNELDCHHINPLSLGGTNDDDNLMLLCRECHKEIHYGHR